MAERRLGAQKRLLASAKPMVRRMLVQHHAKHFMGRRRDGTYARTFSLDDLKIDARDPANVRIQFNREEKLPEGFREGDKVPRRHVEHVSDIFSAVRTLAHISDRHAKELASANGDLAVVERINAKLAASVSRLSDKDAISSARRELEAMGETRRVASAYKSLAAKKLAAAEECLKAFDMTGNPLLVSSACAVLTAFRNRVGEWRTRQIARIDAYEELRECSLRMRRDRYLEALFAGYGKSFYGPNAKTAFCDMVHEMVLCEELARFEEQLPRGRGWEDMARTHIHAIAKDLPEGIIRDNLRAAYRMAKRANKDKFLAFMRGIARQLQVRDPRFIVEELQKSGEEYLDSAIGELKYAIGYINYQMPKDAARHFRFASEAIRR
jgi:hypothetical protein